MSTLFEGQAWSDKVVVFTVLGDGSMAATIIWRGSPVGKRRRKMDPSTESGVESGVDSLKVRRN